MNIMEELKTDALNAWQAFEGDVEVVAKRIGIEVKQDVPVLWKQFGPIAMQLVLGFASAGFDALTGGAKLALASTALLNVAKTNALDLAEQDAPGLIQQAYDALSLTNPSSTAAKSAPAQATGEAAVEVSTPPASTVAPAAHGQAEKPA